MMKLQLKSKNQQKSTLLQHQPFNRLKKQIWKSRELYKDNCKKESKHQTFNSLFNQRVMLYQEL